MGAEVDVDDDVGEGDGDADGDDDDVIVVVVAVVEGSDDDDDEHEDAASRTSLVIDEERQSWESGTFQMPVPSLVVESANAYTCNMCCSRASSTTNVALTFDADLYETDLPRLL